MTQKTLKSQAHLINTVEAGELLSISPRRVIQLIQTGRLPFAMKVGRNYLIHRDDLRLVEHRKTGRPKKMKKATSKRS
jgi:excisionase family DNA binding protein